MGWKDLYGPGGAFVFVKRMIGKRRWPKVGRGTDGW